MTVRRRLTRLAAAAAAMFFLAACGARVGGDREGFIAGDGSLTRISPAERRPAPQLTGTTLDGQSWSSGQAGGQVIVYNVWGSWCAPCRKEAPALVEASTRTVGVATFVGINTRDLDRAPAQAFVRAFGVPYVNLFDPDGRLLLRFGRDLPASAIPSTLVIDQQGRLAARVLGETTASTLVGLVTDVAEGR